jgi:hypothetical protein
VLKGGTGIPSSAVGLEAVGLEDLILPTDLKPPADSFYICPIARPALNHTVLLLVNALYLAVGLGYLMVLFCSPFFAHGLQRKRAVMANVDRRDSTQG